MALNAGAAIYVAGLADNMTSGIAKARQVIADGSASKKLASLVQKTNSFK